MKTITIPIESRVGELSAVMEALDGLDILDVDAQENERNGFIFLTVNEYDEALRRLRHAGYRPVTEDALVLQVKDEPGALAMVARRFRDAVINVRSLHILRTRAGWVDVCLVTDNNTGAEAVVEDLLISRQEGDDV